MDQKPLRAWQLLARRGDRASGLSVAAGVLGPEAGCRSGALLFIHRGPRSQLFAALTADVAIERREVVVLDTGGRN
ncbi:hypothetical protein AC630_16415 [Bradyrhizobium sp. AS23.2]|nr:hypothetical protein AC630_16415 [Bradyrhizobium sp. AS23.2]